jgi:DNA polymerase I
MASTVSPTSCVLVDASIYIFRAWFSIPDSITDHEGFPVNAAYGFARFLTELAEQAPCKNMAIAFDESLSQSFRNEIYAPYKANRELVPESLERQFLLCRRFSEAAGIACFSHPRYEADDLIATLARLHRSADQPVVVVTGDKDLAQVLVEGDMWWDYSRKLEHDINGVKEKFGVYPDQIADYLGLVGDAVDNIPGVPGVGAKTAAGILDNYDNLDTVYENLDKLFELPVRGAKTLAAKLVEHKEVAYLSRLLATVESEIDIADSCIIRTAPEHRALEEVIDLMGGRGRGLADRLSHSYRQM